MYCGLYCVHIVYTVHIKSTSQSAIFWSSEQLQSVEDETLGICWNSFRDQNILKLSSRWGGIVHRICSLHIMWCRLFYGQMIQLLDSTVCLQAINRIAAVLRFIEILRNISKIFSLFLPKLSLVKCFKWRIRIHVRFQKSPIRL